MRRSDAVKYIGYCVDDSMAERDQLDMPAGNVRLIGWKCAAKPFFVAVWSYMGNHLTDEEATEIAVDLLEEKHWFVPGQSHEPDYVL